MSALIKISPKFVATDLIAKMSALFQVMSGYHQTRSLYLKHCRKKYPCYHTPYPGHSDFKLWNVVIATFCSRFVTRIHIPHTTKLLGVSPRLSVRLSRIPCLLYNSYSSGYFFHIRHKWSLSWDDVSRIMSFDFGIHLQGYSAVTLPILWIIFTCGTNITHQGMICHIPFPGQ